jgi:hypothetical protein
MKASGGAGWKSVDGDYSIGEFHAKKNSWLTPSPPSAETCRLHKGLSR